MSREPAADKTMVDDARTWIFERGAERLELARRTTPDGLTLVVTSDGPPRSYSFNDETALARFQSDMETFLLETGWAFSAFVPERRSGRDRRGWPRIDERRRWWTDGIRFVRRRRG
jgi:hypothetical protein